MWAGAGKDGRCGLSAPTCIPPPQVKTDWAGLIDNWAVRFLHEMDYSREARNALLFREQMSQLAGARPRCCWALGG